MSSLPDYYRLPVVGQKMLEEGDWACDPAVYQEVEVWIEEHWGTEKGVRPPAGCIRSDWPASFGQRDRLETPMA